MCQLLVQELEKGQSTLLMYSTLCIMQQTLLYALYAGVLVIIYQRVQIGASFACG